jgi:uncharacterized protein
MNTFTVFAGTTRIAQGSLADAALAAKRSLERDPTSTVLVFDGENGKVRDLDLRGTDAEVAVRYMAMVPAPARGRPRLGVVPREVTLLPRHWDWLAQQPGGASVALRKLVEQALKANGPNDASRQRQEAAYRFMSALAGDLPDFEEASRALFAGDIAALQARTSTWPADIQKQLLGYLERNQ